MKYGIKDKLLSIVACMAIAILLLANVSHVVMAQSDLAASANTAPDESGSSHDIFYYSAIGAISGAAGISTGLIAGYVVLASVRGFWLPLSVGIGGGLLGGIAAGTIVFLIGYVIH